MFERCQILSETNDRTKKKEKNLKIRHTKKAGLKYQSVQIHGFFLHVGHTSGYFSRNAFSRSIS